MERPPAKQTPWSSISGFSWASPTSSDGKGSRWCYEEEQCDPCCLELLCFVCLSQICFSLFGCLFIFIVLALYICAPAWGGDKQSMRDEKLKLREREREKWGNVLTWYRTLEPRSALPFVIIISLNVFMAVVVVVVASSMHSMATNVLLRRCDEQTTTTTSFNSYCAQITCTTSSPSRLSFLTHPNGLVHNRCSHPSGCARPDLCSTYMKRVKRKGKSSHSK